MKKVLATALMLALSAGCVMAQDAPPPQGAAPGQAPGQGRRAGGFQGARGPRVGGTITKVAGTSFTIKTMRGDERTIAIPAATPVMLPDRKTGTFSDLKVGVLVNLNGTQNADGTFTVARVNIQNPTAFGVITALTATRITVQEQLMPAAGARRRATVVNGAAPAAPAPPVAPATPAAPAKIVSFNVTTATVYGPPQQPGKLTDFKVGDRVMVQYKGADAISIRSFAAGGFGGGMGGRNGGFGGGRGAGANGAVRRGGGFGGGNQLGGVAPADDNN
ncbi:MAG TPA: DUF5666 domain-containing protein [Armatimonadota bacterium]|jgi:hypothetical protein